MTPDAQLVHLTIEFCPTNAAADDLAAISAAEDVRTAVYQELTRQPDATVRILPGEQRSGGVVEFVQQVVQSAADHQTLLAVYTGALVTIITRLLKHRRVGKVELKDGERTLIIEDADLQKVQPLITDFLASSSAAPAAATETAQPSRFARALHLLVRTKREP